MKYVIDFHIHSQYSRGCSKELTLFNLVKWAEIKGIGILGTGDFTFPAWREAIAKELEEAEEGLYVLKGGSGAVRFIITTEISLIYKQGDKCRRVHVCLLMSSRESAAKLSAELGKRGNIKSDGRPILGLSARDLTELVLTIDEKALVIPAHAWTPWFSVFGSKSGFDSLEECFGVWTPYIYAIETGLSASVEMNWMCSFLDSLTLLSNSDAHSLENLGREANVFDLEKPSYNEIYEIIKNRDCKKFLYSINFFPEEGKYHLDGHGKCGVRWMPLETEKNKGICSKCKRPVTKGVLNRVYELADRELGEKPETFVPFKSIVPLRQIISEVLGKGIQSKAVKTLYFDIAEKGGGEFPVLLDRSREELSLFVPPKCVEGIMKVRKGDVRVIGGYDGVFGTVKIWDEAERSGQRKLL